MTGQTRRYVSHASINAPLARERQLDVQAAARIGIRLPFVLAFNDSLMMDQLKPVLLASIHAKPVPMLHHALIAMLLEIVLIASYLLSVCVTRAFTMMVYRMKYVLVAIRPVLLVLVRTATNVLAATTPHSEFSMELNVYHNQDISALQQFWSWPLSVMNAVSIVLRFPQIVPRVRAACIELFRGICVHAMLASTKMLLSDADYAIIHASTVLTRIHATTVQLRL